jgi:hypothetical protein
VKERWGREGNKEECGIGKQMEGRREAILIFLRISLTI